ncbi:MAG: hypothetical protein MZV64_14440 [Ignavibacteriales bacterium]|nr:hypothetical protein [Ignavibacteriales bacterium]
MAERPRSRPCAAAGSTTSSGTASTATRPTPAGSSPISRRCSTTRPSWPRSTRKPAVATGQREFGRTAEEIVGVRSPRPAPPRRRVLRGRGRRQRGRRREVLSLDPRRARGRPGPGASPGRGAGLRSGRRRQLHRARESSRRPEYPPPGRDAGTACRWDLAEKTLPRSRKQGPSVQGHKGPRRLERADDRGPGCGLPAHRGGRISSSRGRGGRFRPEWHADPRWPPPARARRRTGPDPGIPRRLRIPHQGADRALRGGLRSGPPRSRPCAHRPGDRALRGREGGRVLLRRRPGGRVPAQGDLRRGHPVGEFRDADESPPPRPPQRTAGARRQGFASGGGLFRRGLPPSARALGIPPRTGLRPGPGPGDRDRRKAGGRGHAGAPGGAPGDVSSPLGRPLQA